MRRFTGTSSISSSTATLLNTKRVQKGQEKENLSLLAPVPQGLSSVPEVLPHVVQRCSAKGVEGIGGGEPEHSNHVPRPQMLGQEIFTHTHTAPNPTIIILTLVFLSSPCQQLSTKKNYKTSSVYETATKLMKTRRCIVEPVKKVCYAFSNVFTVLIIIKGNFCYMSANLRPSPAPDLCGLSRKSRNLEVFFSYFFADICNFLRFHNSLKMNILPQIVCCSQNPFNIGFGQPQVSSIHIIQDRDQI